jgi:hypothetical protein
MATVSKTYVVEDADTGSKADSPAGVSLDLRRCPPEGGYGCVFDVSHLRQPLRRPLLYSASSSPAARDVASAFFSFSSFSR